MKVYVVMGNDFPDAVFSTRDAAETYCRARADEHRPEHRVIYWRANEFELDKDPHG